MKEIIKNFIEGLEKIIDRLKKAYDETWGCEDLSKEFNEEITCRKEENKEKFVSFIAGVYTFEAAKKGILLHEDIARDLATDKFNQEVDKGNVDELNNIKEGK